LLDPKTWVAQREIMEEAARLMANMGQEVSDDFNAFTAAVDADLKSRKVKLAAAQKNQILNAVSWRDETAKKVIKKRHKLAGDKLKDVLSKLGATVETLPDHGYWPIKTAGEFIEYESDSELRDSENVPLKDDIHAYFLREVRPHVKDAWLDIASVKIGYEISFNRYFYQHKPLRDLNEVARDILELERETDGLLKRLVSLTSQAV
jgi:type I restriction enzyme M protein